MSLMFAATLAIPAVLLALLAWVAYRPMPQARLFCLAVFFGMGYWYLLPGTLFLLGGELAGTDTDLLAASSEIGAAILLVHVSFVLLLLLPAYFSSTIRGIRDAPAICIATVSAARLDVLLLAMACSSITYLAARYAELGPGFVLQLLVGLISAREVMTFGNFSTTPTQSLLALWDIINIFLSVFLVATLAWERRTLSVRFMVAVSAGVLSFVSSGSRSVLLLMLFAVVTALICRPNRVATRESARSNRWTARSAVPLLSMGAMLAIGAAALLARFPDDPSRSESLVFQSIGVDNDMFRELVFVLRNGTAYRTDALLFLQTPITYAMPSFLGFDKSIAPHLIDFNMDRAGIDLISGVGNVFPGLVADMYLCFGVIAPLVLCASSAVMFAVFVAATTRGSNVSVNRGLLIALLCYYVISFRNFRGELGIVVVLALALSVMLSVRSSTLPRKRRGASRLPGRQAHPSPRSPNNSPDFAP
jgi:hypothetical protein